MSVGVGVVHSFLRPFVHYLRLPTRAISDKRQPDFSLVRNEKLRKFRTNQRQ